MAYFKFFTVLCLVALVFSGGSTSFYQAYAQKGVMFSSKGVWATKDLASSKKGASPYCLVAMPFSKNTIFTIAENKSGDMSLAFDFGGGYFDPSVTASVVLDSGEGWQRSFRVRPRSSKAIVIKLGDDPDFMEALVRTGLLRLEIEGQSLSFRLDDIDKGRKKLSECLDGVIFISSSGDVSDIHQENKAYAHNDGKPFPGIQSQSDVDVQKVVDMRDSMVSNASSIVETADAVDSVMDSSSDMSHMLDHLPSSEGVSVDQLSCQEHESLVYQVKCLESQLAEALEKKKAAEDRYLKALDDSKVQTVLNNKNHQTVQEFSEVNDSTQSELAYIEEREAISTELSHSEYMALQESYEIMQMNLQLAEANVESLARRLEVAEVEHQKSLELSNLKSMEADQKMLAFLNEKEKVTVLEAGNRELKSRIRDLEQDYKILLTKVEEKSKSIDSLKVENIDGTLKARSDLDVAFDESVSDMEVETVVARLEDRSVSEEKNLDSAVGMTESLKNFGLDRDSIQGDDASSDVVTQAQTLERALIHDLEKDSDVTPIMASKPNARISRSANKSSLMREEDVGGVDELLVVTLPTIDEGGVSKIGRISEDVFEESSDLTSVLDVDEMSPAMVESSASTSTLREYARDTIGKVLQTADIIPAGAVNYVEQVSSEAYQAYEWRTDKVFGSAEQRYLRAETQFDDGVLAYLENVESRCNGDFAVVPFSSVGDLDNRVDSYEVACVGKDASSAATIVFYEDAGKFTVVAHESSFADIKSAMDIRDRLIDTIRAQKHG